MSNNEFPRSFGVLLYPQFEVLDIAGPVEALNVLSRRDGYEGMKLSLISKTLEPVGVGPIAPDTRAAGFLNPQIYPPTHTFDTAPEIDVLLVPGGLGSMDPLPGGGRPDIEGHIDFIRKAFYGLDGRKPLKYLISICNGSILLIKAGVLAGQTATTNKDGWKIITQMGPKTNWVGKARWVDSGRIWTTSGVSAGTDGVLAWMESLVPEETLSYVVKTMEWIRAENSDNDPFAEIFGCEDVPRVQA